MVKHIVFTKFKEPDRAVPTARALLAALSKEIPEIRSMETGRDFLGSARSWDMALVATFDSREALAVYADHPAHQAVKAYIHAARTDSATVDYEF